ncbi:MAG: hypothetical protein ACOCUV_03460 [bacterium]
MRRILIAILLINFHFSLKAEDTINYWIIDTSSNFNQSHSPFENTLTMWMLRQNFTLNAYQANIGNTYPISGMNEKAVSRAYFDMFLPVVNKNSFSAMLGTSYSKFPILAENDSLNKTLVDVCRLWLPIQYTHNRWKITLLYEYFQRGDYNSLYTQTGNTHRAFLLASYNFNLKWQLSTMLVYAVTQMEAEKRIMAVPAFQLRYKPNSDFTMTFGAPVIFACEWTVLDKIDIAFSQLMLDDTDSYIRYNFNKKIGVSLNYKSTNYASSDIFFKNETISLDGQNLTYNNLKQQQTSLSLKLGIKTFNHIGVILSGGYNIGQTIWLHNNNDLADKSNGRNEFYIGINVQYLKLF